MRIAGGWKADPIVVSDGKLSQKLATGFSQAFLDWQGARFEPLIYCGTQVVNGTNHMVICKETRTTNPMSEHVAKVVLHETLPKEGQVIGDFSVLLIETIV